VTVSDHCYSLASLCGVLLRRLAARSLMPLLSIGCCGGSASETDVARLSMSLLYLALALSGTHLPCGCASVSAILVFFLALQYLSVSMAILCAAIEFSTPIFGKLAQAPIKRPAASVDSLPAVDVGFLSMTQLAKHETAIREWLLAEPSMGYKKLCTMMLSEKSCHVQPTTARSYLKRLQREPETPSRKKRRPIKGSCAIPEAPAVDVGFLPMTQLAKHETAIREWLLAEPDMGCKRLCTMMLSEKSCHVNPRTAQNYLTRLRREPQTPSRKRRRPIQGSCAIPEAPAGVETTYLDLAALSAYDVDIREWLSIEPDMGYHRLASKFFEKTGLRANPVAAQNYLFRFRGSGCKSGAYKEPGGTYGQYVKKRPAAASVAAVADDAIVWESAASLRAYDEEAGQWFEHEPTISKTGLLRKFFAVKGLHLKLSVAESYLKRLRVAAGQPSSPRALRNRLAGVGASTRAVKADLDAFGDLTLLSKDADLEFYMPALTVAFASEPCVEGCRLPPMTLRRLQFVLAGQGVKTTRAAATALLDKLKTAFLLDKVDVFRPGYRQLNDTFAIYRQRTQRCFCGLSPAQCCGTLAH